MYIHLIVIGPASGQNGKLKNKLFNTFILESQ